MQPTIRPACCCCNSTAATAAWLTSLLKQESAANREKLHYELVKIGCGGRLEDVSEVLNHLAQAVQGAVPLVQQVTQVLTGQGFPAHPVPEHVPDELRSQADEFTQEKG